MATHTYRFSEFQAGLVESGKKTMTIRAPRKVPTRAGDTLRLTGPIFAGFAKVADNPGRLLRSAVCRSVLPIELRLQRALDDRRLTDLCRCFAVIAENKRKVAALVAEKR
jgi:hypothetical protein